MKKSSTLWLWLGAAAVAVFFVARSRRVQNIVLDVTGNRMYLSIAGMDALKRRESPGGVFNATAYLDVAGFPTIGYGHKLRPGESYPDGIDEQTAIALLAGDIREAEDAVNSLVSVPLAQAQFDALVSFAYNVGSGAFEKSTLLRKLNAGDYAGAQDEFPRWDHAGGVQVAGLTVRRADEAEQFGSGAAA